MVYPPHYRPGFSPLGPFVYPPGAHNYGQPPVAQPYGPPEALAMRSFTIQPPPYTGPDPVFRPTDPLVGQTSFPPHSPLGPPVTGHSAPLMMHVSPLLQNRPPPPFQLSNCQGRKRALLIGINYFGTPNELQGCINDVHNIKHFLITMYNFQECNMMILTDDQMDPRFRPTKQNIIQAMHWLVHDARPNDSFFLHFSGHGGRVKDMDMDESDGYDETIYPVDHYMFPGNSGQLIDDEMHEILVRPLPAGCRLTAIFDSCHSGTALDLPYVYTPHGSIKPQNIFKNTARRLYQAGLLSNGYYRPSFPNLVSHIMSQGPAIDNHVRMVKSSPADVIMFSGCKDWQTSADSFTSGVTVGAMSHAFTMTLRQNPRQSYLQLLNSVRFLLAERFSQTPQLSSSHPIDVNMLFIL